LIHRFPQWFPIFIKHKKWFSSDNRLTSWSCRRVNHISVLIVIRMFRDRLDLLDNFLSYSFCQCREDSFLPCSTMSTLCAGINRRLHFPPHMWKLRDTLHSIFEDQWASVTRTCQLRDDKHDITIQVFRENNSAQRWGGLFGETGRIWVSLMDTQNTSFLSVYHMLAYFIQQQRKSMLGLSDIKALSSNETTEWYGCASFLCVVNSSFLVLSRVRETISKTRNEGSSWKRGTKRLWCVDIS
jgi:hypothetical protein